MATGLEAVGAASAILSFITFAGKIVSLSYKIYDGMPTDEHELQDYAGRMLDASERIQSRNQQLHQATPAEVKLCEIAQKCAQLAGELQKESQSITRRYQKGKFRRAVSMAIRANAHKAKMKELEQSLDNYRKVMETELLSQICDQNTAIQKQQSQAFPQLELDVQHLISNLASGQTKVEKLVTEEADKTRVVLSTNIVTHIKASEEKAITDAQRLRLLKSLKAAQIRKRYNDVMNPSDASFERVFASYERVCRNDPDYKGWENINTDVVAVTGYRLSSRAVDEIDCTWQSFCSWLQSDNHLFWIQGKPGSGKSTLMKFIIENDNTKCLLESWIPNTRILSFFLWKIGHDSQNSVKGLLCCLLHDLLADSSDMLDQVLKHFSFSKSKDFYEEWSSEEAEKVLSFLLHGQTCSTCIFIDGLDEICDKDGFESLTAVLKRIYEIPSVKVCISSRLETGLIRRLQVTEEQKLRLHDLTKPEMTVYIHTQLARFSDELISKSSLNEIILLLLEKAEGVFLWLFLAKNSVVTGIENGDDEETLIKRLQELPSELEALYETMWSRLNTNNKVYREIAARYFVWMLADGWNFSGVIDRDTNLPHVYTPTLAQLSMVVNIEEGRIFPPSLNDTSFYELNTLCDATERDLMTRCAGMIQVSKSTLGDEYDLPNEILPFIRSVQFIHRTAHDFLSDTKPGQVILNYYNGMKKKVDYELKIFKSELYLSTLYSSVGLRASPNAVVNGCMGLQIIGADDEDMFQLLQVIRNLSNRGIISPIGWFIFHSLPAHFACRLSNMEDVLVPWMMQSISSQDYTVALRDICLEWRISKYLADSISPIPMIQKLIALDANPHAVGATSTVVAPGKCAYISEQASAFQLLLLSTLNQSVYKDYNAIPAELEVLVSMATTCQDWHRTIVVAFTVHDVSNTFVIWDLPQGRVGIPHEGWVTFEMNMHYLFNQLLVEIERRGISVRHDKFHEIANSTTKPYSRIRHIGPRYQADDENLFCCRIIDQKPFEDLCGDNLCDHAFASLEMDREKSELFLMNLIRHDFHKDPDYDFLAESYEVVLFKDEADNLVLEDLGIHRVFDRNVDE